MRNWRASRFHLIQSHVKSLAKRNGANESPAAAPSSGFKLSPDYPAGSFQMTFVGVSGMGADVGIMNDEPHIIIGQREGWGNPKPFGVSAVDHRHHVYIIGKTGSGKTTLLRNLLVQHI